MKRKIYAAFMASCMIVALTACEKKSGVEVTPTPSVETNLGETPTQQPETKEDDTTVSIAPSATPSSLEDLSNMLGKKDNEVKDLLGGGTENMATDGSTLVGRIYNSTLFEKQVAIHTLYNENGTIHMIQTELTGTNLEDCQKQISKETGVSMKKISSSETGQKKENGLTMEI